MLLLHVLPHLKVKDIYGLAWLSAAVLSLFFAFKAIYTLYNAFLGPLSKFPGPRLRAITILPEIFSTVSGNNNRDRPHLHQKYGPVVRVGPNLLSFVGGDEVWKDVYGFHAAREGGISKDPIFYSTTFNLSKVPSLIVANPVDHARQRRILSHAFSDRALKDHQPMLHRWADMLRQKLAERADGADEVDMLRYYNYAAFDIMADLTFNEELHLLEKEEYSPWVQTIFKSVKMGTFVLGLKNHGRALRTLVDLVLAWHPGVRQKTLENWRYCTDRVDRRLQHKPEHPDLWSKVLRKADSPEGLSVEEQYSNAFLFMTAGTETTATALSGTTYHLLRSPTCMERLTAEVRSHFGRVEDLDLDKLAGLKYLEAVIQEGLRMYPPVPISLPRVVPPGGVWIAGQWIPGGTKVGVHHLATYRSEEYFSKPYEFHPERWLGDPAFAGDRPDAFKPFLTGPMNCIGKNLAWHEMRLLLATVALCFDLELVAKSAEDWKESKVFTLWEKKPLLCRLTPVGKSRGW